MARADRNHPLTGTRGPMVVLEWTWFQWVVGLSTVVAPGIALVAWAGQSSNSDFVSVPNVFVGLFIILNAYFLYAGMQLFDGTGTWSLRWALGSYMKLMAILHAVGAMFLIAKARDGLMIPDGQIVPDGVIWITFGILWAISGASYLIGDAHIRIGRRNSELSFAAAQKALMTPGNAERRAE